MGSRASYHASGKGGMLNTRYAGCPIGRMPGWRGVLLVGIPKNVVADLLGIDQSIVDTFKKEKQIIVA